MKKLIFCCLALLGSFSLLAQPTVGVGNRFIAGDSYTLKNMLLTSFDFSTIEGQGGANQVWDYGNRFEDTDKPHFTRTFLAATSTPYSADYPSADIATHNGNGGYVYWDTFNDTLNWLGVRDANLHFTNTNPAVLMTLPLTYNDTLYDTYSGQISYAGFPFTVFGNTSYKVDGYGTLITPDFTYSDVIRVHFKEYDYYSMGDSTVIEFYSFLKDGIKGELMTIHYQHGSSQGTPFNDFFVRYKHHPTSDTDSGEKESVVSYLTPNPCNDFVTISNVKTEDIIQIAIYDMTGKLVLVPKTPTDTFDTSLLPSGVYRCRIILKNYETINHTFFKK